MSCDIGEVTESLENQNELWRRWSGWKLGEWAELPVFQSLNLRHSSFSNPSLALPTSQLILQPFCCFTYATVHSPTFLSLLLRHRIFTYVTWRAAHVSFLKTIYNKRLKCYRLYKKALSFDTGVFIQGFNKEIWLFFILITTFVTIP